MDAGKPNENQDFVEEKVQFELKNFLQTKSRALISNFWVSRSDSRRNREIEFLKFDFKF